MPSSLSTAVPRGARSEPSGGLQKAVSVAASYGRTGASEIRSQFVAGHGGARLAVHRLGAGRPVVLLHGLFSSAEANWVLYGHAARLADAGFEAIMPDLRAHGQSDAPHDPAAYPADVLVKDLLAVIDALGLESFDLGGYSLGSRLAVDAVLAGLQPRRVVLGGFGLEGIVHWGPRNAFFLNTIDNFAKIKRGDPNYMPRQLMRTMKIDRVAARLLLGSPTDAKADELRRITMPTLVVCGSNDLNNGSGLELAEALPDARFTEIPGTHLIAVMTRDLSDAIVGFLSD